MSAPVLHNAQEAIDAALSATRPEDVIEGVKAAVRQELAELDPAAEIEDTRYFNHTYVPDFVLTWREAGRKNRRDVYLRPSLASTLAARDLQSIGSTAPVLLALRRSDSGDLEGEARRDVVEHAPNALVTGVGALDEFTGDDDLDEPLQALVRPNLVRGGRGVISGDTLSSLHVPLTGGSDDIPRLEAFGALVRDVFLPDAATRLERAAQILEVGLTGDVSGLSLSLDDDPADELVRGRLSDVEMEVLLPYLLSRADVTREPAFWSHVGSMLDLERLERMTDSLTGLDLTPLINANLSAWAATRAFLAATGEAAPAEVAIWRIVGKTLATRLGEWRLHITADNRRLRGREDSLQARWDELAPRLRGRPVTAVALNGVQRRVNVTADQAADVFGDVEAIRTSIRDEFYVPAVSARSSQDDDAPRVDVDFTRMLATAAAPAPLRDLAELATVLLGHRVPVPEDDLRAAVGDTAQIAIEPPSTAEA
ncbi:hypothetical protein DQ244_04235 [Blastococcus sp. TBT05-19]|uniref:hypothetical protein n=1 Tax=Blastococcus sp. TBT05-19 TaxID=2250581 RepID=UPI000DE9318F|nr:hypothetical protein [Blastococcus sp. TBT05-19]RBY94521.1 hypothetical protein DQ244_04235 [Blastococcus sp. TBT05-19]